MPDESEGKAQAPAAAFHDTAVCLESFQCRRQNWPHVGHHWLTRMDLLLVDDSDAHVAEDGCQTVEPVDRVTASAPTAHLVLPACYLTQRLSMDFAQLQQGVGEVLDIETAANLGHTAYDTNLGEK